MREPRFEQILGVRFFNGSSTDAAEYISRNGGYTVVPAAPALANIHREQDYRRALVESDLAIAREREAQAMRTLCDAVLLAAKGAER